MNKQIIITTLGELIDNIVMTEFRKLDKKYQIDFASKIWENDENPDVDMAMDFIKDTIAKYEILNYVLIHNGDAETFIQNLIEIQNTK